MQSNNLMSEDDIIELFKKHDAEYLSFDRVVNKLSTRPDINAFILLNSINESDKDIISDSDHDIIYLSVELKNLKNITEDQIIDLIRCGVIYNEEHNSLTMFT